MPMTLLMTRNAPARTRGFLASVLLEIAPGVYAHPRLSSGVRGRVWSVMEEWFSYKTEESVALIWADNTHPSGLGVKVLGHPKREFVDYDGFMLSRMPMAETKTKG